jgi:Dicarboxylate transport
MRFKVFFRYLFLSFLILVVIVQAAFLVLPALVETIIIDPFIQKYLPQKLPLGLVPADLKFKIEKIGLTHTLVSRIHIGQVLSADLMDFQYGLKDLKRFQLEKITVSGLTLYAQVDSDKRLRINGEIFPGKTKERAEGADDAVNLDAFLGFLPGKVVLNKANLSITTLDQKIFVPFEVLSSLDTDKKKAVLTARFYPFGQTVETIIAAHLTSGIERVSIQAPAFHPEALTGIFPEIKNYNFSDPVDIDILKTIDTDWQLAVSPLKLDLPHLPGTIIKEFKASVGSQAGKISAVCNFDLEGFLVPALGMHLDLNLTQKENAPPFFEVVLKNKPVKSINLVRVPHGIGFDHPRILFLLKGDLTRQTGKFLFDCQNFMATQGKDRLLVKNVLVQSGIKGDFSDKGKGIKLDFKSDLSRITARSTAAKADVAGVTLRGSVELTKQFSPLVQLDARIMDGKVESAKFMTKALGINARLPLVFPYDNENKPGSFSIQEIGYHDKFRASLGGSITQSESLGVSLGGQMGVAQLDGFNLGFNGRAGGVDPSVRIDFVINPFLLGSAQMGKILPKLNLGDDSSIQVSSRGTIEYKDHGVKSRASIMMDKGNLFFPDMNLSFKGVAGSIDFNDLMVPESLPGQVLTIDKITTGQFEFNHAKARFSIEDGQSVNIENLHFNWCNGLVSTESIRLPGKDNMLSLILYCDRLELSSLLKQMGAFHAEGEGSLSGRIPVIYSAGNISFNKGFLFSTPGKGGRVVIENTQALTGGIPMDTPEFVQLDLAREALKDFDYQWAKLELNTSGDTLYMNMELDGKPARILPFEYQKEVGSFVRVDAKSPGSRFQGIKLNVNLKLPFNQVLKFGNRLNSILN